MILTVFYRIVGLGLPHSSAEASNTAIRVGAHRWWPGTGGDAVRPASVSFDVPITGVYVHVWQ